MAKNGKRVEFDGYTFLSESECEFYKDVKKAKKEGFIRDYDVAVHYELQPEFVNWRGKKEESIDHYPDFLITRLDGSQYIIDTKGGSHHEKDAILKRKMWLYQNPNIPYYYISLVPKFLGDCWVETTVGNNFEKKLRSLYYKDLHPSINRATATSPQLSTYQIDQYFDWEIHDCLFYKMNRKYTKKEREKRAKLKK